MPAHLPRSTGNSTPANLCAFAHLCRVIRESDSVVYRMATELSKRPTSPLASPAALDRAVAGTSRAISAEPDGGRQPFRIVIPPPNVTGRLHLGHALNNTLQDILIRWRRMPGDNACWLPGTDHAGIATQAVVEKRVCRRRGRRRHDSREGSSADPGVEGRVRSRIIAQLKAMGCSCDWEPDAVHAGRRAGAGGARDVLPAVQDGLIYRGKRLVNWDTSCRRRSRMMRCITRRSRGIFSI